MRLLSVAAGELREVSRAEPGSIVIAVGLKNVRVSRQLLFVTGLVPLQASSPYQSAPVYCEPEAMSPPPPDLHWRQSGPVGCPISSRT